MPTLYMCSQLMLRMFVNRFWKICMFSERRRASDKVVAYDAEEKALTAKHIQRLQVSKFHRLMLLCGDTSTI